ncbi:pentapeptide repeat family protein [alpha proteobacterium BAL199]|jgi:uncharacterized protein YjbI with pentapeptide repeats|nr:pentapeptide repeat family protein [alpha proteobacterium BAL199]
MTSASTASPDGPAVPDSKAVATAIKLHDRYVKRLPGGRRAQLANLRLDGINLGGRRLDEIDFTGSSLVDARLEKSVLCFANFFGADLTRARLNGADLTRADLRGACFRGADLSGANMTQSDIREAVLVRAGPGGASDSEYSQDAAKHGSDLSGLRAHGADLTAARIGNSFAVRADFTGAQMRGVSFQGADLGDVPRRVEICSAGAVG